MICPKCSRNNAEDKKTCIYCGESLESILSADTAVTVSDDTAVFTEKEEKETSRLAAIPDTVELNVKDIPLHDPVKKTPPEDSMTAEMPGDNADLIETQATMSMDRALSLLNGFKESLKSGHIKDTDYEKLVLEVIKDYIMPMDDKATINFVANGIIESDIHEFINDKIHNDLKSYVITYIASK